MKVSKHHWNRVFKISIKGKNMRILRPWKFIGVCLFIWQSIFTFQANAATMPNLSEELKNAPEWVFNPSKGAGEGELAVVGISKMENGKIKDALKTGFSRGVEELATVLMAKVSQLRKDYISPDGAEEHIEATFKISIQDKLKELASITMEKDEWVSPGGEVFILAVADKKGAKELLDRNKSKHIVYAISYRASDISAGNTKDEHLFEMYKEGKLEILINEITNNESEQIPYRSIPKTDMTTSPQWIKIGGQYKPETKKLIATGVTEIGKGGLGLAIMEARADARNNLAIVYSSLTGGAKDYVLINDIKETNIFEPGQTTKIVYENILQSSEQIDIWISPEGDVYVLVEMEVKK